MSAGIKWVDLVLHAASFTSWRSQPDLVGPAAPQQSGSLRLCLAMGGGASRREPEVHVVVVQSQENGKMDAKLLRQTFVRTGEAEKGEESIKGGRGESIHCR